MYTFLSPYHLWKTQHQTCFWACYWLCLYSCSSVIIDVLSMFETFFSVDPLSICTGLFHIVSLKTVSTPSAKASQLFWLMLFHLVIRDPIWGMSYAQCTSLNKFPELFIEGLEVPLSQFELFKQFAFQAVIFYWVRSHCWTLFSGSVSRGIFTYSIELQCHLQLLFLVSYHLWFHLFLEDIAETSMILEGLLVILYDWWEHFGPIKFRWNVWWSIIRYRSIFDRDCMPLLIIFQPWAHLLNQNVPLVRFYCPWRTERAWTCFRIFPWSHETWNKTCLWLSLLNFLWNQT